MLGAALPLGALLLYWPLAAFRRLSLAAHISVCCKTSVLVLTSPCCELLACLPFIARRALCVRLCTLDLSDVYLSATVAPSLFVAMQLPSPEEPEEPVPRGAQGKRQAPLGLSAGC